MSGVRDRNVIDIALIEDGKYVLVILDDLEWNFGFRQEHGRILQNKINDYLDYIASGQAAKDKPGLRVLIRILSRYAYSAYCIRFLERVRAAIQQKGNICDIEWTHSPEDGPFEDGFSDDYVFDERKIYPRLKKNWAKDPLREIALMPPDQSAPDYSNQMIMIRWMDSFIGMFVQDMGNVLTYLTYDMVPEGTDIMKLQATAFDNLVRDIRYRAAESGTKGVFGILAGGDFESESLCLTDLWRQIAENMQDDLMICAPTKDIVYYTGIKDKKLCRKMKSMAYDMFEQNRKESPNFLLCKDVFLYSRDKGTLEIVDSI
jgi:hypothetical protein